MPTDEENQRALEERAEKLGGTVEYNEKGKPYIKMPSTTDKQEATHQDDERGFRWRFPRGNLINRTRDTSPEGKRPENKQR